MPRASSVSLDPAALEIALFPCFATLTPRLAKIIAQAVEIFIVFSASPPVPTMSNIGAESL